MLLVMSRPMEGLRYGRIKLTVYNREEVNGRLKPTKWRSSGMSLVGRSLHNLWWWMFACLAVCTMFLMGIQVNLEDERGHEISNEIHKLNHAKRMQVMPVSAHSIHLTDPGYKHEKELKRIYGSRLNKVPPCETIHIMIVCIGHEETRDVTRFLKSLIFYRTNYLHLHFLTDSLAEAVLSEVLRLWLLTGVEYTFHVDATVQAIRSQSKLPKKLIPILLKLIAAKILPKKLNKIIFFDSGMTLNTDVVKLWAWFGPMSSNAIGMVERENVETVEGSMVRGFDTSVMLFNLQLIRNSSWHKRLEAFTVSDRTDLNKLTAQNIIHAIHTEDPSLVFTLPCEWNVWLSTDKVIEGCRLEHGVLRAANCVAMESAIDHSQAFPTLYSLCQMFAAYNGNLLRHELMHECNRSNSQLKLHPKFHPTHMQPSVAPKCRSFIRAASIVYRVHPYYFKFEQSDHPETDVTLVTQLSLDRLGFLLAVLRRWKGPVSAAVYLRESDTLMFVKKLKAAAFLKNRTNIGFHVVFQQGTHYPINHMRNVALQYVHTEYSLLFDIDFLPSTNLHDYIMKITRIYQMNSTKLALVIPSFETWNFKLRPPAGKDRLLAMLEKGVLSPYKSSTWKHKKDPTDYERWKTATSSYEAEWVPGYQPYIAMKSSLIPQFDRRFVGWGWNKISHIMELHAKKFTFLVIPREYMIHYQHSWNEDSINDAKGVKEGSCVTYAVKQFKGDLIKKYGEGVKAYFV